MFIFFSNKWTEVVAVKNGSLVTFIEDYEYLRIEYLRDQILFFQLIRFSSRNTNIFLID